MKIKITKISNNFWLRFSHLIAIFSLTLSSFANGIEIYQDEKNSLALRGYISGVYYKDENVDEINEAASRWGFDFTRKLPNDWQASVTLEWGLVFDTNNNLTIGGNGQAPNNTGDDNMFTRLGYIQFSHPSWGDIAVGKQWAAYYDITYGTDILNYWGGSTSGSLHLNSDGGISGTGRAEQAITWRKSYQNFHFAVQVQAQDEAIELSLPEQDPLSEQLNGKTIATINNGFGISVIYDWNKFAFGVGFNSNQIEVAQEFGGSDSNDEIFAASVVYGKNHQPGLYFSAVTTRSKNHEFSDTGSYIDAKSSELIVKYSFANDIAVYGGFNHLTPDDDDYQGSYKFHYNFAGIEYVILDSAATLFIETRFDDGKTTAGEKLDDSAGVLGATIYF